MKNTMTVEQAWNWLGNRGIFVNKKDIRVRGIWAFLRDRNTDDDAYVDKHGKWFSEVEYYHLDKGNTIAEAYDGIPYTDSPFMPDNEEKVAEVVKEITEAFYEEYPEERSGLCLVAIEGDCSSDGMGDSNHVLPIELKHKEIVQEYLKAVLNFHINEYFRYETAAMSGKPLRWNVEAGHEEGDGCGVCVSGMAFERDSKATIAMRDAGIFRHKYHSRTRWELTTFSELAEMKRFQPYKILEVGEED